MSLILSILIAWPMFGNNPEHTGFADIRFDNLELNKAWEFSLSSHIWRFTPHTSIWSSQAVVTEVNGKKVIYIGAYDQNLYCIDGSTGVELWRFPTSGKVNHAPLIIDFGQRKTLYFGSTDRTFYAVDARSGDKVWSYETLRWEYTLVEAVTSSPVGVKIGKQALVFVGFWNANRKSIKTIELGEIFAFDAESGRLLWRKKISGSYLNSPALTTIDTSLLLFVTTREGKVFSISAKDGDIVWEFTADGEIFSSPSIMDLEGSTYLLFGTRFGSLYCLNARSGKEKWSCRVGHIIDSTPAIGVVGGRILLFFGSYDRCVYAVDGSCGKEVWRFPTGKYISASAAVAESEDDLVVFINSLDDIIYALRGSDGKLLWKFQGGKRLWDYERRGESLWSSPIIYSIADLPYVLYPCYDGKLYAFTESE